MEPIRIVLAGIGGYGTLYVNALLDSKRREEVVIVGAVDPYAEGTPSHGRLASLGVAMFDSLEAFYAQDTADLAILSTPISLHAPQTLCCLSRGSHVLVEKPIAATVEEAEGMIRARDAADRLLAVGYQWCYDAAMLRFKADVDAGRYGRLVSMRAIVLWPRDEAYYRRGTGWAGKRYTADGAPVFDNVASNATAHYLMNMLWIAGCGGDGREVERLEVRTARANAIETFDTICLKAGLSGGAELLFAASHAIGRDEMQMPVFEYVFQKGIARYGVMGGDDTRLTATLDDGTETDYGCVIPEEKGMEKAWHMVDAIRGLHAVACPPEVAIVHTRVMEEARRLEPDAAVFPAERVRVDQGLHWVPGLRDTLLACYETATLPERF